MPRRSGRPANRLVKLVNTPDLETLKTLARGRGIVPISREILGDTETPVSAYLKLRPGSPYSFLFESVEGGEKIGRYSFLGVEPFLAFRSWKSRIEIEDLKQGDVRSYEGSPIAELRRLLGEYRSAQLEGLPRFTGGAVGYVAYDAIRLVENIPDRTHDDHGLPDVELLFYDTLLGFDNVRQKIHLISNVHTSGDVERNYQEAEARIDAMEMALRGPIPANGVPAGMPRNRASRIRSNTERSVFLDRVRRCKEYIVAGDIFQVVLSQRFETEITVGSLDVYRALRTVNPSPYMFHLDFK
ncbi:MAG: chorismate-binding protein, partial [Candidatus Latescibacteria bacterium]|nr:chorismate-binding protein [Candidatus Latescibacterota bacterium]